MKTSDKFSFLGIVACLFAFPASAVEPVQGVVGCPSPSPSYTSNCTTLQNVGTVKNERGAINERGCPVFGARAGALRPVNQPAVFYGVTACPARGPVPADSPGIRSPFRERTEYTLVYAGRVYNWTGPDGARTTDWKCWWDGDGPGGATGPQGAAAPQDMGPCVVCY